MTTPSDFLRAIRDQLRVDLPGLKQLEIVDRSWGEKDKDHQAVKTPAVLLTCLRIRPDEETHQGDFDRATLVAICIAQRADNQADGERTKALTAMDLASSVSVRVREQRWNGLGVSRPENIVIDPIRASELADKGYAAWSCSWTQVFDPHIEFDASLYGPLKAVNNTFEMGGPDTPDQHATYTASGAQ